MEQVIAYAKLSRTTIYSNFPDKGALIEAMFAREPRRIVSEEFAEASLALLLEQALTGFGERFVSLLSDPETLALERLIALVADAHPTLAPGSSQPAPVLRTGCCAVLSPKPATRASLPSMTSTRQRPPHQGDELQRFEAHCAMMFLRIYGVSG